MQEGRNSSLDRGLGATVLAVLGATVLVAVLFLLSPWNVSHIADKSAPREPRMWLLHPIDETGPMIEQERVTGGEHGNRIC